MDGGPITVYKISDTHLQTKTRKYQVIVKLSSLDRARVIGLLEAGMGEIGGM